MNSFKTGSFNPGGEYGAYDVAAYFYNRNEGRKEVAVNDRCGLLEDDKVGECVCKGGLPDLQGR